jgi:hypothetical protein
MLSKCYVGTLSSEKDVAHVESAEEAIAEAAGPPRAQALASSDTAGEIDELTSKIEAQHLLESFDDTS